jgi:thiamine biosynthesis protein ThiS
MVVIVNGESRQVPAGTSVRGLVELLGLGRAACAVEVNQGLVRRAQHETTTLREGDRVEVVTLVGGG